MLLRMAIRNLSRYRLRSTITIIAITISVFASVLTDGLLRGLTSASAYNLITYESSEAVIYRDGYFEDNDAYPADLLIDRAQVAMLASKLTEEGISYAPRYKSSAEIIFSDEEKGFDASLNTVLIGIASDLDESVYALPQTVESGRWLNSSDDGIVIGGTIAEKLGLSVGSVVSLSCKGRGGFNEIIDTEVQGIFVCDNAVLNGSAVYMSLDFLDDILALDGSVSEISISDGKLSAASSSFASEMAGLVSSVDNIEVLSWQEVNAELVAVMSGKSGTSYALLLLLFLIAAVGIANTMMMAVMERQKECAMLRAVGFSEMGVSWIFVLEGVLTGIIGSVLGIIVAALINYPLARYGLDLTGMIPSDVDIGYRITFVFHSGWYVFSYIFIPATAVLLSAVSAFLPVSRSGRREVAELLRRP